MLSRFASFLLPHVCVFLLIQTSYLFLFFTNFVNVMGMLPVLGNFEQKLGSSLLIFPHLSGSIPILRRRNNQKVQSLVNKAGRVGRPN